VVAEAKQESTGEPVSLILSADRDSIQADGRDVSVVTVEAKDGEGRIVPTAANEVEFSMEGPGHIIGVGNGDPICHEPDQYFEEVSQVAIQDLRMKDGGFLGKRSEIEAKVDDSKWPVFFSGRANDGGKACTEEPKVRVVRGSFELPRLKDYSEVVLYPKSLVDAQAIYVNGHLVAERIGRDDEAKEYPLPKDILREGVNTYVLVGKELLRRKQWEVLNKDPGYIRAVVPAGRWKRSLFNGLAQVIVQADSKQGTIVLKAYSTGLAPATLKVRALEAPSQTAVP
jgi:beta-galactosidase